MIEDDRERAELIEESTSVGSISLKTDWAMRWITDKKRTFAERLVAFVCVEGIYFSSSFAFIFRLKSKGMMRGLCMSNDFISRDEGLHTEFACMLIRSLKHKPDEEVVRGIVRDAVQVEIKFARGTPYVYAHNGTVQLTPPADTLSPPVLGLNTANMGLYIMYVVDQLLLSMGYSAMYHVLNPVSRIHVDESESLTNIRHSISS